ncbi:MAG: CCA tRNA nucleotidyltransferase [Phycisphaerales bacterium]
MGTTPDPLLARAAATSVVRTLREAGHTAYFAGGCVRDELLGHAPSDYDIATDATPERVRSLFPRTNHVGAAFGVTLVHVPAPPAHAPAPADRPSLITVEVATFRSDGPYADNRRPDSVVFADAPADAARRDFTINALFLDPLEAPGETERAAGVQGRVIDLVRGVPDLSAKLIRAVGNPDARLAEDHLRALRAVRFAARLGFTIEPATGAAIRAHAAQLAGVSKERIGEELRRMFEQPPDARTCAAHLIQSLWLDAPVLGEAHSAAATPTLAALPASAPFATTLAAWTLDRAPTPAARAALMHETTVTAAVARLRAALCLSNADAALLSGTFAIRARLLTLWPGLSVALQKRTAHHPAFASAFATLTPADTPTANAVATRLAELTISLHPDPFAHPPPAPEPLITGDDLIGIGLVPGPAFKALLDGLYDAQLEGRIDSREAGMELARRLSV